MTEKEKSKRLSAAANFDTAYDLLTTGKKVISGHDSLTRSGHATKRISKAKAQAIGRSLTDRDRRVLDLFSAVQMATGAQIRRLVWGESESASRSARRQLAKLIDLRVVSRLPRRPGGVRTGHEGFVYLLDVVGQHLTSDRTPRRPRQPNLSFVEHSIAVTECQIVLRAMALRGTVELIHFETEPWCWRHYFGPGGAPKTLRPDAFVITASGEWEDRWYLEVDQSSEAPSRIRTKALNYISYWQSGKEQASSDIFPRVLFVVPDDRRLIQIVRTLSDLPADHWQLFQVTESTNFASAIEAGAGQVETQP
jgi:hypothetical protein